MFYGVATVGPLLGLMGTVLGMIQTFNVIAAGADALGRAELLAGGIAKALLNTAGGLAVAIPASIFYVFFVSRVDRLVIEIDRLAQEVVNVISAEELQERKTSGPKSRRTNTAARRRRLRYLKTASGFNLESQIRNLESSRSAMPLKTHLDDEPTLNLTAMLDVMFLLIIFFMLGTRFIDDERKIGLRVPEVVDRGTLTAAPARKEVNVYRDGTITLDQAPVTLDELTARLAAARRQYSDLGVLVRGDAQRRIPAGRRRAERLQAGGHSATWASPSARCP